MVRRTKLLIAALAAAMIATVGAGAVSPAGAATMSTNTHSWCC